MTRVEDSETLMRASRRAPAKPAGATRPGSRTHGVARALPKVRLLRRKSFLYGVLAPTIVTFLYLQFFATRQYVTDFQFTILPSNVSQSSSSGASGSGIGQSSMGSGAAGLLPIMDNMIMTYVGSQQAVLDTEKRIDLRKLFDNDKVDILQRFWWDNGSYERLTAYWNLFVASSSYDVTNGLCDIQVKAFTPQDSARIARTLEQLAEQLVNNQSLRQRRDMVAYAQAETDKAKARLDQALAVERAFRQSHESIDPSINGSANQALGAGLQQSVTTLTARRDSLAKVSPGAPSLGMLDSEVHSARTQLAKVAAGVGGGDITAGAGAAPATIAQSMRQFEAIEADVNFASQAYQADMQNLQLASLASTQQQFYLSPYVSPTTPQNPTYPQPLLDAAVVFGACLFLWGLVTLIMNGLRQAGLLRLPLS